MGIGKVSTGDSYIWTATVADEDSANASVDPNASGGDVGDSSDPALLSYGDVYTDAEIRAALFKASVNSAADAPIQPYAPDDPRFADLNAALEEGDGSSAMAAANKLLAELKSEKHPDPHLLNEARMALAAGAMMAGKPEDAKQALLSIPAKSLSSAEKEQFEELRDLLAEGYRASFSEAFDADMAEGAAAKDAGKAAADEAKSLLELLQKTDPQNSSEIDRTKLRLANALLAGGHYREAAKAIGGMSCKQLGNDESHYLDAIEQGIHEQQIGALAAGFRTDIQKGRYKDAAENATAQVNDIRKYFPEAKAQLTEARLDQATAYFLNGDIKNARKSVGYISQEELKNAGSGVRARYGELQKQIEEVARERSEQTEIQQRLENIGRLIAIPDQLSKEDAVAAAAKLLADVQSRHPGDTQAIERMKLITAEVAIQAGQGKGAADLAKEIAATTTDEDTKDQAQLLQAQALLSQVPPQNNEAAKMLRVLSEKASSPEAQKQAKDMLIALETSYVEHAGHKAEAEVKAVDDYKKDRFGGGKWEVTFDVPEEKALYQGLHDISAGAKLAASVMKANGLSMRELQSFDEKSLPRLAGVHSPAEAQLLRKTLDMTDMARISIDDFDGKHFTWDKGTMYADLSIYKQPLDSISEWIGNRLRGAREQEREWERSNSTALHLYGMIAGGALDGISAADRFAKDAIKTAREYYAHRGGILGKVGGAATWAADMLASPVTMPATVLDYKASDEERAGAIQGTLLIAATAGLLKMGGPALRAEMGALQKGVINSRLGQYVAKSWLGRASRWFEQTSFAKGVDKLSNKLSNTLGKINRFGKPKLARSVKDVVSEVIGEKTAGEITASVSDKQIAGLERKLMGDEYKKLFTEKNAQFLEAKKTELARQGRNWTNLPEAEQTQLERQVATEAKKAIRSEYGEEGLRARMRANYSEDDVRRMLLGGRIYRANYGGNIQPKPATISQAEYQRVALAKGEQVASRVWKSPDGRSLIHEDGYWHYRFGKGELDRPKLPSGEDIRRFYFNVRPDQAGEFAQFLTDKLNDANVAWEFKMPKEIKEFNRPDAGVLYVEKGNYQAVKKIVLEYAGQYPEAFANEIPAFTKELRPGIAAAEEPLQNNLPRRRNDIRHSHGSSRSDIMAEAIVDAPANATKREIVKLVRERMEQYGLDPDRPWLAKSTNVDDL